MPSICISKTVLPVFAIIVLALPLLLSFLVFNSAAACISYSSTTKTITVSCTSVTHLTNINTVINNPKILKKDSNGVWLLSANLVVAKGGNVVIDSSDTSWLKIFSDGSVAYGLKNSGTLKIDSVKITSWNVASNTYSSPGSDGRTPRGYIVSSGGATGTMNIFNSEISYLGYKGTGHHGLDYYGGEKSVIQNNQIHHNWRAFYSSGVGGLSLNKNVVHDNYEYGIDPHSGTHDMYITYNKSYNNNHGIICSQMCYNIHIENNELYKNKADGIFLDAGSHHSTIKNNNIHDQETAIQLPSLSYSEIYGNTVTNSKYGIKLYKESGFNTINNNIHNNNIKVSNTGIEVRSGAATNSFNSNTIDGLGTATGIVVKDSATGGNVFGDNHISNVKYSISLSGGNTNSKFSNNHLDTVATSGEYTLSSSSALKLDTTQFSADVIKSLDSSSNPISISKSGVVSVTDGTTGQINKYDTNLKAFSKTLTSNAKITVTSIVTSSTTSFTTLSSKTNSTAGSFQNDTAGTATNLNDDKKPSLTADKAKDSNSVIRNDSISEGKSSGIHPRVQQKLVNATSFQRQMDEGQAKLAEKQAEQHLIDHNNSDDKQSTQSSDPNQRSGENQKNIANDLKSIDSNLSTKHVKGINHRPTADAGPNRSVNELSKEIALIGHGKDIDRDKLSFSWKQISGTPVKLERVNAKTNIFNAPEVDKDITLRFLLSVDDGKGGKGTDTVTILVKNVPVNVPQTRTNSSNQYNQTLARN